jgi:hypothetical protein
MAYYTEEDRKRAAAKRKLNSQFKQLINAPEDFYDIMGISVPHVTHKPTLDEYGLPDDVEERLEEADAEYVWNEKSKRKVIAVIVSAFLIWLFFHVIGLTNETAHPEYFENGRLTNNAIAWGGAVVTFGGLFGLMGIWIWAFGVEPKQTYEHQQLKQYKDQLSYFEYWQRKNNKDHWNKMSGHGFEQAVANLFRNIGFTADVSNQGGDGGVDIILQKEGRRIAVQCKRYKSSVGPHVIRDLWGTMNYLGFDEGCIVTTTGFTKGVSDFAKDKNIFLIDLNDILRATGEDGDVYLMKQIGEY